MNLKLRVDWIRELDNKEMVESSRWRSPDQWQEVSIDQLSNADLDKLVALMDAHRDVRGSVAVKQKIITYQKLLTGVKGVKISRLEPLVVAVKMLLEPTPNKWLFSEGSDGHTVPWYVHNVKYHPADERNGLPACTKISMSASKRGATVSKTLSFSARELGASVSELLNRRGFYVETPEAVRDYENENAHYQSVCGLTGVQFRAGGIGDALGINGWSTGRVSMERDYGLSKVVMDDKPSEDDSANSQRSESNQTVSSRFWTEDTKRADDGGATAESSVVTLPVHPYVNVFDLARHCHVTVHTANLSDYAYDRSLIHKLVLPEDRKELLSMLVEGADLAMEDIVQGKTGGIIVICTGHPGTGKTLSAEVFSEQVRRPLYAVQCSQLGTDEVKLEKELTRVLNRAQRWKAVLLIDEADVYVHERGTDLQQNAIVGVFLRVLEHYRGVLFMTSNRETIIDDAIMSRATAWIHYEVPDRASAMAIWKVLSTQYGAGLSDKDTEVLAGMGEFKAISGRSIKNLLKLAKLRSARKKEPVTVQSIIYVSQFLDLAR